MWAPDVYERGATLITAFCQSVEGGLPRADPHLRRRRLPTLRDDWRLLFCAGGGDDDGEVAAITQSNVAHARVIVDCARRVLLIGIAVGTARGITAMLICLFIYAFMQLSAFVVVVRRRDAIGDELKDFNGSPESFAAFAMLMFMLSSAAFRRQPASSAFWLFSAAIDAHCYWLAVIGVPTAPSRSLLRPHRRLHVSEEGDDRLIYQ